MSFCFETFNDEHNLPKALAEAQFVYLHMEIKSVFAYFWIHCLYYYMTKPMSNAFPCFYAATPLIYRLPFRSIFFSQQTDSMWEEKLWYASLCPPHWQCVCVCARLVSGTMLTSTACLPSVIRIWMPIWLNRLAFTPVSSMCSVPSMRSTHMSANTAKRWGPVNTP